MIEQSVTATTVAEAASAYKDDGFQPVPITPGTKRPVGDKWQHFNPPADELSHHFGGGVGIGLILGARSGGLIDVDLDSPEAVALAEGFLPATSMVWGTTAKPRSHYGYRVDTSMGTTQFKDVDGKMLVELRGDGGQSLVPPSNHPNGGAYLWGSYGRPAEVAAEELRDRVAAACHRCATGPRMADSG